MFANIYLNELDKYIKEVLKVKWQYRFMDDSVLIVQDKQTAKYCLEKITRFLQDEHVGLNLKLNNKTQNNYICL